MQISHAQNTTAGTAMMASCNSTGDHGKTWGDSSTSMELLLGQENQGYDSRGGAVPGIIVPILFGAIVIVGLPGNALVVLIVLCNRQMRSTTNILIMNLAVADLLFLLFCVPFKACVYTLSYWPFGDAWCRIVQYLFTVCAGASIYTLVLMSVVRFLAVVYPLQSMPLRTPTNAFRCILLTWITTYVSCVPVLAAQGMVIVDDRHSFCTFRVDAGFDIGAFYVTLCVIGFVVPLALIFALYAIMLKRLWLGVTLGGRVSAESTRVKRHVTRLVIVVVLVFAICWCPLIVFIVLQCVGLYRERVDTPRIVLQIALDVLACANSCVNPFLYAFLSDSFRKGFCKVFSCFSRASCGVSPACNVLRAGTRALDDMNGKELVNEERV